MKTKKITPKSTLAGDYSKKCYKKYQKKDSCRGVLGKVLEKVLEKVRKKHSRRTELKKAQQKVLEKILKKVLPSVSTLGRKVTLKKHILQIKHLYKSNVCRQLLHSELFVFW